MAETDFDSGKKYESPDDDILSLGTVVKLKSSSVWMTIMDTDYHTNEYPGAPYRTYKCAWFDKDLHLVKDTFRSEVIEIV